MNAVLTVPALSLVILVGPSGSGKSTFARQHFLDTEVISSDFCRGLVADDDNDQSATNDAFDLLHHIVGIRLRAGRLTVVDATNVQARSRQALVALAKEYDVLPVAIVLDLPVALCVERNATRTDRDFGASVVRRQHDQLRRGRRGLAREGFRQVHVLTTPAEVEACTIERTRLYNDRRDDHGPFDIVGDIHGCRTELELLLDQLGYLITRDDHGHAVGAHHAERRMIFVGDLVDRGPDSPGVLRLVMGMVAAGDALCVSGNHEAKLLKRLRGRPVQISHGLAETLAQLNGESTEFQTGLPDFLDGLLSHYVLDDGNLVVSHAGLIERYHGRTSARVRSFCLYGDTTGETDEYGLPVRLPWARDYRGRATVVYGHTPIPELEWVNNTLCLDTGCVFGGSLSALRYPERETVSVPASEVYYEPVKPFLTTDPAPTTRAEDVLDLDDVLATRIIETPYLKRIGVRAENAAAALEVMSRFAIDPRWLLYLPPTMSPVATSAREGLLEHPEQAFAAYRADGVTELVCEEKHMGSRAVIMLCRDQETARSRFWGSGDDQGAVWTRTGRAFFNPELNGGLVDRLVAAAERAGLFDEVGSPWLLLDAEILPWSAKAEPLLREQYAAVGAAARGSLPVAVSALEAIEARGVGSDGLLARTQDRAANAEKFSAAYRRYVWPTDGLDGVRVAAFQLLASEGVAYQDRPHSWHLGLADRLVEADPELLLTTRRVVVDVNDEASTASATQWWDSMVGTGGEGMVVKPSANLTRSGSGMVQPGLKVRGPEYLRIIYGPDYTEPANLSRLRSRSLGHKRSMALREYALGLEALDRVAAGEPLWRVHECVFAILALESEPVDPRL